MLVNHLTNSVLKQYNELVEGFDLTLQFDPVDEVNGYWNAFLTQYVQIRVL
jgi:hypothetical protein